MICANTDDEADSLASSFDLAWLRLAAGRPTAFPRVEEALAHFYTVRERMSVEETRVRLITGSPDTVRARLCALTGQTGAEEVMVTTLVNSPAKRLRSYQLLAAAFNSTASLSRLPLTGS